MAEFTPFFWIGTAGMGLGTIAFVRAFFTDPRNRVFHSMLAGISGIAFVAYLLMALGMGSMRLGGEEFFVARYADWALTTPLLIAYLGLLAGIGRRSIALLIGLDLLMIGAGVATYPLSGALRFLAFGVGALAFVALVWGLTAGITEAVKDRPSAVRGMFHKLRNLTVGVWLIYPFLWLLGPVGLGLVDPAINSLLFTYADLIAKVGFGLIALNSQRALANLPKIDTVSRLNLG